MLNRMSAAPPARVPFAYTDMPVFRLTVGQYHELIDAGILTTEDPVELLEGVLVYHMSQDPLHAGTVEAVEDVIRPALPAGWRYRSEKPITLADGEPEPDGVIARGARSDSFLAHPTAADVALVIEVSNSTLGPDRTVKLRGYARAGIPVYWIVNLIDRQVEVYADPDPAALPEPAYRTRTVYAGDAAVPVPVVGTTVPAAVLLPPVGS